GGGGGWRCEPRPPARGVDEGRRPGRGQRRVRDGGRPRAGGHQVRLWSRSSDALGPLAANATLTLEAEGRHGTARLERATTDLAEAVEGAEVLRAPLPATSHEDPAKRLAPGLNDRQIVLLTPATPGSCET